MCRHCSEIKVSVQFFLNIIDFNPQKIMKLLFSIAIVTNLKIEDYFEAAFGTRKYIKYSLISFITCHNHVRF